MNICRLIVRSALSLPLALSLAWPGTAEADHICPDWGWFYFQAGGTARAENGDVIDISAGGVVWDTRNPDPADIVDWGGAFVRRDQAGNVVAQGTVTLLDLSVWKQVSCEEDDEWIMGAVAGFVVRLNGTDGSHTRASLSVTVPAGDFDVEPAVTLKVASWGLFFGEPLGASGYFFVL